MNRATLVVGSTCFLGLAAILACSSTTSETSSPAPAEQQSATPPAAAAPSATPASVPTSTPTTPPTSTTPKPPVDAGPPDTGPATIDSCFHNLKGAVPGPNYEQFNPVVGKTCAGTQHQKITGVERLVFLGDSITTGTPPNLPQQYYRTIVTEGVKQRFGQNVDVQDCSGWGARTDDYIDGRNQIGACFPNGVEQKKTLIVMTMGGNDIDAWAKDKLDTAAAMVEADKAIQYQRDAVTWLKDPTHFPNGSYVVFSNVYEYTDTTGDLYSCPAALAAGLSGSWSQGAPAVVYLQEQLMKIAVDTQSDMIFMLEAFCGHGYHRMDANRQCYRGPNAPLWFDISCIHPNPEGHGVIAKMMLDVIDG